MPALHDSLDAAVRLARIAGMDIPEQLRVFAQAWADADAKAYELDAKARSKEDSKSAVLAKRCKALGGNLSIAAAEREVKAAQEWHDFLVEIEQAYRSAAAARHEANKARGELDYWKAKFAAWLVGQNHAREMAA